MASDEAYLNNLQHPSQVYTNMTEEIQAEQGVPLISFKKRTAKAKSSFRKKAPSPPPVSASASDYTSSDDEGRKIKRRRKNAVITASSATASTTRSDNVGPVLSPPASTPLPVASTTNDATRHSNWYDNDKDTDLSAKSPFGDTKA